MKRGSISLVITDTHTKTTMCYYHTPTTMAKIKNLTTPSAAKNSVTGTLM